MMRWPKQRRGPAGMSYVSKEVGKTAAGLSGQSQESGGQADKNRKSGKKEKKWVFL